MDDYKSNEQNLRNYIELCKRKPISDISSMIDYIESGLLDSKYNNDEINIIKNVSNMYYDHENPKDMMLYIYEGYYLMKGGVDNKFNKIDDKNLEDTMNKYATKFIPVRNKIINTFEKYDTPENKEILIKKIKNYLGEENIKEIKKIQTLKSEISKFMQQFFIEYIYYRRNKTYVIIKEKFAINIDNKKILNNKVKDFMWSSAIQGDDLEEMIKKRNDDDNIKWRKEDENNIKLIEFINKLFRDNACIGSDIKVTDIIKNFDFEFFVIFGGHVSEFLDYEKYRANVFMIDNIYKDDIFVSKIKGEILIYDFDTEWNKMIENIESIKNIFGDKLNFESNKVNVKSIVAQINNWIIDFTNNLKNQKNKFIVIKDKIDAVFDNIDSDIKKVCNYSNTEIKCDILYISKISKIQKPKCDT